MLEQAFRFHQIGNLVEAERLYLNVIAADPLSFNAFRLLGVLRAQQGRNTEALELIGRALEVKPDVAKALSNYGSVLASLGRLEEALVSFDKALWLELVDDERSELLIRRGLTFSALKRFDEALGSYGEALNINPRSVEALNNRGVALLALKRNEEALKNYDAVLAIAPESVETLDNRGLALRGLNRLDEALINHDAALAIRSDDAEALNNRGITLLALKRHEDAIKSFEAALAINPNFADAIHNRGDALWSLRRTSEALVAYESVLTINPEHAYAFGGRAAAALNLCDWRRTAEITDQIKTHIAAHKPGIAPAVLFGYSDDPMLQLECAKLRALDRIPAKRRLVPSAASRHAGKIKLAYLSPDFHSHATAYLMAELFERHDRRHFDVMGISFGPDDGSEMRARLLKAFDEFHDVRRKSDQEVASLLRDSNVHIAIDLNGHMQSSRPGIFSYRPCPVQVSYLGYPGTMGADFIDYIIADPIVAPFDQQPFFSEKIVHLPECYQVNDSKRAVAMEVPSRKDMGLPDRGPVFCCFNNSWKITAPVFDVWMRLLRAVPNSALWLLEDNAAASTNLRVEAAARGADLQRLVFAARTTPEKHLARHSLADLFLDTLPYNAHTTASDSLWMGVPLVTCLGKAFSGRVAASLLHAVGLPELVTRTLEDYENLALQLARDPSRLQMVRQKLTQNRPNASLFDTDRFRRHIESAYTAMWEIAQKGEAPRSFRVQPNTN
jgi:predicted O-linked N-acetylglucosamine transferase (SPINDLY family)